MPKVTSNRAPKPGLMRRLFSLFPLLFGFFLILLAIDRFFTHNAQENVEQLKRYSIRKPSAREVQKYALPKPRIKEEAPAEVAPPHSPTGDPELDVVYVRNPEWREKFDQYRVLFVQAQGEGRQLPAAPEAPWLHEERMQRSVRWAPNPWGLEP